MDRPGFRQVPKGSGEQGKMEETGCEIICGAPLTLAVKELMIMRRGAVREFSHPALTSFNLFGDCSKPVLLLWLVKDSGVEGHRFDSWEGRWEDFFHSVLTFWANAYSVTVLNPCYHCGKYKTLAILPKCRWQATPSHERIFNSTKFE